MADTVVSIFNRAVSACHVGANIASETENSAERRACSLWYDTVLRQVLQAAQWPAATAYKRLALKTEATDETWVPTAPAPGYQYVYNLPADFLWPRNLTDYQAFEISLSEGKRALSTNANLAILCYTAYNKDITTWDEVMKMAVIYGLASVICGTLTGKRGLSLDLQEQANGIIEAARVTAENTNDEQYESLPSWIEARGVSGLPTTRFIYQNGNLLRNVGSVNVS